jgi:hypothetical protein
MRFLLFMVVAGSTVITAAAAQKLLNPVGSPTSGVIQSFDGKALTVATNSGMVMHTLVTPATKIFAAIPKTLADIKPGDFIASGGTRGADGKLRANEIRIFSAPAGEGQFPMSQPGQTMTNATVERVMTGATVTQVGAGGTPVIKLTFHGAGAPGSTNCTGRAANAPGGAGKGCVGETQFEVPANVPIVALTSSDAAMLKPGAHVTVEVVAGAGAPSSASRITLTR